MLKKNLLAATVATATLAATGATSVQAEEGSWYSTSANAAITTDYRFRGISQSDESVAVQAGFDVEFTPGFYAGLWGSSVDFGGDIPSGSYGTVELNYVAGWAGTLGDSDIGIDVGYIYYDYPGDTVANEGDYQEVYVGTSYGDWVTFQINYSDDYYAETDEFWYFALGSSFSLPNLEALTFDAHLGYNILDEDDGFLAPNEDEYFDYRLGVTYSLAGFDFSLAWVGTDLDRDDVGAATEELADDTAVFTIAKSL